MKVIQSLGHFLLISSLILAGQPVVAAEKKFQVSAAPTWQLKRQNKKIDTQLFARQGSDRHEVVVLKVFKDKIPFATRKSVFQKDAAKFVRMQSKQYAAVWMTKYNLLSWRELRLGQVPGLETESRVTGLRGEEVQIVERRYFWGGQVYQVTYTEHGPALRNHEKVMALLDQFKPNAHARSVASLDDNNDVAKTSFQLGLRGPVDEVLYKKIPLRPGIYKNDPPGKCDHIPADKRYNPKTEPTDWGGYLLTQAMACGNWLGDVAGDTLDFFGNYVSDDTYRDKINDQIVNTIGAAGDYIWNDLADDAWSSVEAVYNSEVWSDPMGYASMIVNNLVTYMTKEFADFKCLSAEEQGKILCKLGAGMVAGGAMGKIVGKILAGMPLDVAESNVLARSMGLKEKEVLVADTRAAAENKAFLAENQSREIGAQRIANDNIRGADAVSNPVAAVTGKWAREIDDLGQLRLDLQAQGLSPEAVKKRNAAITRLFELGSKGIDDAGIGASKSAGAIAAGQRMQDIILDIGKVLRDPKLPAGERQRLFNALKEFGAQNTDNYARRTGPAVTVLEVMEGVARDPNMPADLQIQARHIRGGADWDDARKAPKDGHFVPKIPAEKTKVPGAAVTKTNDVAFAPAGETTATVSKVTTSAEKALGNGPLSPKDTEAVWRAHTVGMVKNADGTLLKDEAGRPVMEPGLNGRPAGIGNYTPAQQAQIKEALEPLGFGAMPTMLEKLENAIGVTPAGVLKLHEQ